MAGSVAEERIREKVVASLRRRRPDARIVHELVLRQGGERIDVAAVWADGLILAEIKSERDKLTRLQRQLAAASELGAETWLCVAERWREPLAAMSRHALSYERVDIVRDGRTLGYTEVPLRNPAYVPELSRVDIRYETEGGLTDLVMHPSWYLRYRQFSPFALLNMLWAEELRIITGLGSRSARQDCIDHAVEHLTGRQVRRSVCAAIRARAFPRADAAVEWPAAETAVRLFGLGAAA